MISLESFKRIQEVYQILNEHVKLGISIHPAGEWLLDNLYIIEETVKQIQKELTLKKYTNFAVVNIDDEYGENLLKRINFSYVTYSIIKEADYFSVSEKLLESGFEDIDKWFYSFISYVIAYKANIAKEEAKGVMPEAARPAATHIMSASAMPQLK